MTEKNRKNPMQGRSRQTVENIVTAAAHILETGSEKEFTTNKVAEKAGHSIGSLYQFFPNKFAIIEALARREEANTMAKLTEMLEREGDDSLENAIRGMVRLSISSFQGRRRLRRFIIIQVVKLNLYKWAFKRMEITAQVQLRS